MAFKDRVTIQKGTDKHVLIRLTDRVTKLPIDLTNVTNIQVIIKGSDRTDLIFKNINIPAKKARAVKNSITFTAVTAGALGNYINLLFDGYRTVADVTSEWNSNNPNNTVIFTGNGSTILAEGLICLTGGNDAYLQIEKWTNPAFGQILLRLTENDTLKFRTGLSQSIKILLDTGLNPGGFRCGGTFDNKLEVLGDA